MEERLLAALASAFGRDSFTVDGGDILFKAENDEIGQARIWNSGTEVTVEIGKITHGHFDCYDEELGESGREESVVRSVIGFLTDLFAGRVVLWQSTDRASGGWFYPEYAAENRAAAIVDGRKFFLWPGPISLGGKEYS